MTLRIRLRHLLPLVAIILVVAEPVPAQTPGASWDRDTLYQVSTIDALMAGVYDGSFTCGDLRRRGNLGLGTFQDLDGEMIVVDGVVYQAAHDGSVRVMDDDVRTPFAAVTWFEPDISFTVQSVSSLDELEQAIDARLPSKNLFHAFRIQGRFNSVQARSVPAQTKPYPPLAEAVKQQNVFDLGPAVGELVGFRCPVYAEKVNVVGYHLHYISADRTTGGHLLDLAGGPFTVLVDETPSFLLQVPSSGPFQETDLSMDRTKALEEVEK
ncbi:acetolactate decarboxylase [Oceanidesulfovibrio indonesiensis]|uniref:Alpha-acetolactate decarboxylase n=1 Tax=Oceanidesulfovibrio indonesiensis TaxID=54767 RepID=A0A7M3MCU4_9BACT|nr:acetolactate decarboxylase [Oceanidesulfovibrio indonesiensis]TVM15801.1 acetolactate decarboxylase [Oceanidesulfovibrio indonesiensis]